MPYHESFTQSIYFPETNSTSEGMMQAKWKAVKSQQDHGTLLTKQVRIIGANKVFTDL